MIATETLRAALYYRVSTLGQVDAFGFDAQKRLLPEYAERQGWEVTGEYQEAGISGDSLLTRPAMQQLLTDAGRDRFDVILVIEDTRLSRGELADWQFIKAVCDQNEVKLATPQGIFYRPGNDDDDFMTDIRGAMSKQEKKKIARRMKRGLAEAAKQGNLCAAAAPYGYTFARRDTPRPSNLADDRRRPSDKRLVVTEEQAEAIRLIYRLIAYGLDGRTMGCNRAAYHLTHVLQVPPARGERWHSTTVRNLVKNTVYKGQWFWGRYVNTTTRKERPAGEWIPITDPDIVPPIVTPELWEAANAAIEHRNRHGRGRPPVDGPGGLLNSYLRCAHCEHALWHEQRLRPTGKLYRRYACTGRREHWKIGLTEPCPNGRWPAEDLEDAVWQEIVRVIRSPELLREIVDAGAEDVPKVEASDLAIIQRGLAKVETAAEQVKKAYRAEVYSLEELQEELGKIRVEREALEDQLAGVQQQMGQRSAWEESVSAAIDLCREYRAVIDQANHEEKRRIIEDLLEEVIVSSDGVLSLKLLFGPARSGRVGADVFGNSITRPLPFKYEATLRALVGAAR